MQRKPQERACHVGAPTTGDVTPAGAAAIPDLDRAWSTAASGARLRAVQVAAEGLRHRFASGPRAVSVRTLPLVVLPYPTRYAFSDAALSVAPYVLLTHRCLVVQFLQADALKTLLFNPTDVAGARATPFFARQAKHVPKRVQNLFAHEAEPLAAQLSQLGIAASDVDYLAFDNMHAQDLRPLFGEGEVAARFPAATLVVPKIEWEEWDDLHPLQRDWFVRDGRAGANADRVALTNGDLMLGDGVMLLRTPGHTAGNQTLFINTASGVWGASANGSAADSWSPLESKIPGLRSSCRRHDRDLVLNSKTPARGGDQYISMALEKIIVDRLKRAPAFAQMLPTSEVTPSILSPGLKPTVLQRAITHGEIVRPARMTAADTVRTNAHPAAQGGGERRRRAAE